MNDRIERLLDDLADLSGPDEGYYYVWPHRAFGIVLVAHPIGCESVLDADLAMTVELDEDPALDEAQVRDGYRDLERVAVRQECNIEIID